MSRFNLNTQITSFIFTFVGMILVRKQYKIIFDWTPILKYLGVAILASLIVYYISEQNLVYTESVFNFLPQIIPLLVLGGGIYFGITYIIDKSTKSLFHSILNELRRKRL